MANVVQWYFIDLTVRNAFAVRSQVERSYAGDTSGGIDTFLARIAA